MEGRLDLRNLREIESWRLLPVDIRKVLQEVNSPAGSGDYVVAVKGRVGSGDDIEVSGELSVRKGSFRLWDAYPVERVDGQIFFSRERISIPHLQGNWKNSDLALRAALTRPGAKFFRDLRFSGVFDLRDIAAERFERGSPRTWRKFLKPFEFYRGKALVEVNNQKRHDGASVDGHITFKEAEVRHVPVFPPLTDVEGRVSFHGKGIETVDVEGKFDSSLIRIRGDLAPASGDSQPFLSIQAERVDFEKVMSWPWTSGYSFGRKSRPPLAVRVRVDNGGFREIPFSDVQARLKLKGDRISFEEVTFISTQGQGLIRGWLGLGNDGKVSFEFRPYFLKVETNPIVRSFQSGEGEQELSGLCSALGVIRGGGNKAEEIVRSLNGEIGIFLEGGRIGQFGVLAQVFSLLNPSQRDGDDSPDPKTGGLTYGTIMGKVTLREGRASTSDLLLDSDSIRISAVGDFEIPSGGLDLRLGLRRIGARGKVIRTVPVFGKIVTTDRGSFIHYYLEVKGTIAEPEVKGIPYLSLSDGVSGLIHELLETPRKVVPFQRQPDLEEYFDQRKHPHP